MRWGVGDTKNIKSILTPAAEIVLSDVLFSICLIKTKVFFNNLITSQMSFLKGIFAKYGFYYFMCVKFKNNK